MKAIIISNGNIEKDEFYRRLFKKEDPQFIISVDGGTNHLKRLGIIPNFIVGDLDSISKETLEYFKKLNVEIMKYNTQKDETDTQLAIELAIKLKVNEVILLGSLGTRIDHSLANIYLLEYIVKKGIQAQIIDQCNRIYLIDKKIKLKGKKGDLLSLLPFSDIVKGISTKGVKYHLKNGEMKKENPYGISNVFKDEIAEISIEEGLLLVILSKDNE